MTGVNLRQVIHNPGTIPEAGFAAPGPDVTAVVEEGYATYTSTLVRERLASLRSPHYHRNRSCYIVHSVPPAVQTRLVQDLRQHGAYIFVTDRHMNFYEGFGEHWGDFINAMDLDEP